MIMLIKNGQVFAPEPLGIKDVLIAGGTFADVLILNKNLDLDTVIAGGRRMMEGGKVIARGTFSA